MISSGHKFALVTIVRVSVFFFYILNKNTVTITQENAFWNVVCKMSTILFKPQYVNWKDTSLYWFEF